MCCSFCRIPGCKTWLWVMPSSSARCAQLPRVADKVPFFVALRKFRDHLNGLMPGLDDSEIQFSNVMLKSTSGKNSPNGSKNPIKTELPHPPRFCSTPVPPDLEPPPDNEECDTSSIPHSVSEAIESVLRRAAARTTTSGSSHGNNAYGNPESAAIGSNGNGSAMSTTPGGGDSASGESPSLHSYHHSSPAQFSDSVSSQGTTATEDKA